MTPALEAAEARLDAARARLTSAALESDALDIGQFLSPDETVLAAMTELDAATDEHVAALTALCDERGRELERLWAEAREVRDLLAVRPREEVRP